MPNCLEAFAKWPVQRWVAAGITTLVTMVLLGLPTDVIPNPVFGRDVETTWWSYPVLAVTSVLSGLLVATYVRTIDGAPAPASNADAPSRFGFAGAMVSFFAIGCPVCNKIALIALGYAGALKWFAPVQPYLAVASVGLLLYAVRTRVLSEGACKLPVRT